jgi:hypothetical protein
MSLQAGWGFAGRRPADLMPSAKSQGQRAFALRSLPLALGSEADPGASSCLLRLPKQIPRAREIFDSQSK